VSLLVSRICLPPFLRHFFSRPFFKLTQLTITLPYVGSTAPFTADTNHGLDYRSGMVQTWNKFCFTTGYIEVAVTFPGPNENTRGYVSLLSSWFREGHGGFEVAKMGLLSVEFLEADVDWKGFDSICRRRHLHDASFISHSFSFSVLLTLFCQHSNEILLFLVAWCMDDG